MAERLSEWPPCYPKTGSKSLGKGTYGEVWKVTETNSGSVTRSVALKEQVTNFQVLDRMRKPVIALRAYRELLFLRTFRGHRNIIYLLDTFSLWENGELSKLCTVTELVDIDLEVAIGRQLIAREQTAFVVYGVLCGLKYIHSVEVIHRDLKPANIGVAFQDGRVSSVKLLDFGLARKLKVDMSHKVQTLWYRAPEVWFQPGQSTPAIDMWSIGCILAELISKQVLMKGTSELNDQLIKIHARLGSPGAAFIQDRVHRDHQGLFTLLMNKPEQIVPWAENIPGMNEQELKLLQNIFVWEPANRWTATQSLADPYFRDLVEQHGDGGVYTGVPPDDSFEDRQNVELDEWKRFVDTGIEKIKATLQNGSPEEH